MYQEYLTDTYSNAKVNALYTASKVTEETIIKELTRLKEDVPREGIRDEL
jgi:hypothetical protein